MIEQKTASTQQYQTSPDFDTNKDGTARDERDMRRMGKIQELRVSTFSGPVAAHLLIVCRETSALLLLLASALSLVVRGNTC